LLRLADHFQQHNLAVIGPCQAAAQLEGSKAFAKQFMHDHSIPTAAYATFTEVDAALAYLATQTTPIVIKADGLAAGKGVVVAENHKVAAAAIQDMLSGNAFGAAGHRVVIEEFMVGEEASFIALVDGKHCVPFATSQDHKARDDGDQGPNTGGMGAYSPAPVVTPAIEECIMNDIIQPTIAALAAKGAPYCGFLYAGLMIDEVGAARVVEFNVRLGDPETQPLLMRLDSDLYTLLEAAADGKLDRVTANWSEDAALGVVLAAGSYPASGSQGELIKGVEQATTLGCKVFHAGTKRNSENQLVTAGGRVLCVTARGKDIAVAKQQADNGAAAISWPERRYRRDIGYRAIARLQQH